MIYCPFCIGQGIINIATIKETDIILYICDECDTVWKSTNITEENCCDFENIMNDLGKKALWSELINVERIE